MSIGEFKKIIAKSHFHKYIYASEFQSWYNPEEPIRQNMAFSDVLVTIHPNVIDFTNKCGSLTLEYVNDVVVSELLDVVRFDIICGLDHNQQITVMAEKKATR